MITLSDSRPVILDKDQIEFLLCLVKPHRDYYQLLSGSSRMTTNNSVRHQFIDSLWKALDGSGTDDSR